MQQVIKLNQSKKKKKQIVEQLSLFTWGKTLFHKDRWIFFDVCIRCGNHINSDKKLKNTSKSREDICIDCTYKIRRSIVWLLRYVYGLTYKEIGKIMDCTSANIQRIILKEDAFIRRTLRDPSDPLIKKLIKQGHLPESTYEYLDQKALKRIGFISK